MTGSGFFHPVTLVEFRNWAEIEETLGAERGYALVEIGNTLDLFAALLAWLSSKEHRPHWLVKRENFWAVCSRWLSIEGAGYVYAGRIAVAAE